MSKLLFSPDAAQSSRILLSKEVHNAFDYHKCIRQFKDRAWSHALLRFTVYDEVFPPSNSKYFLCIYWLCAETLYLIRTHRDSWTHLVSNAYGC